MLHVFVSPALDICDYKHISYACSCSVTSCNLVFIGKTKVCIRFHVCVPSDCELKMLVMLNSTTSSPLELLTSNTSSALTGGAVGVSKDSFSNALTKNIVAMLVWLALSIINGSMVHTFLRHR